MPIAQKEKGITIKENELFHTCKKYSKGRRTFLNNGKYVKTVTANVTAFKELNSLYPNFTLYLLDCWKVTTDKDFYWNDDNLLTRNSHFLNYGDLQFNFSDFSYEKDQNYNPWLSSNKIIYSVSTKKILPGILKDVKNLFDKNVIPIKNLFREIGDIKKIIHKEHKNLFLYDNSNLLTHTFFTEANKKIQSYGMISIQFNKNTQILINTKNMLKFNILFDVKPESITLQLKNILKSEKIEMVDSQITNFLIL